MAAFLKILQSLTQLDLVYILLPGGREPGCGLSSQSPGCLFPFPRFGCLRQGLTGPAFQSEERDQLVIHNLPVMSLAPNEFLRLDLNEARLPKVDPATNRARIVFAKQRCSTKIVAEADRTGWR